MNRLFFPLRPVMLLADYTLGAPAHGSSWADREDGKETGPALMWVKDQGTYIMSNAEPRPEGDVIYGRAYAPDGVLLKLPEDSMSAEWDDIYSTVRDICGGDDFGEYFPLTPELTAQLLEAAGQGHQWLVLEVSAEQISLVTE